MKVTQEAELGYADTCLGQCSNPYLYSSPSWYAWGLGSHMALRGMLKPYDVRTGRGSKMHASNMLFEYKHEGWERIA